jgi:fatty acid desaturase
MTASRPWWQLGRTPRYGFVMGTFWAVLGLLELFLVAPAHGWALAVAVCWLSLAVVHLVCGIALRQHQRSRSRPGSEEPPGLPPSS